MSVYFNLASSKSSENHVSVRIARYPSYGLKVRKRSKILSKLLERVCTGRVAEEDFGAYSMTDLDTSLCFEVLSKIFSTSSESKFVTNVILAFDYWPTNYHLLPTKERDRDEFCCSTQPLI